MDVRDMKGRGQWKGKWSMSSTSDTQPTSDSRGRRVVRAGEQWVDCEPRGRAQAWAGLRNSISLQGKSPYP